MASRLLTLGVWAVVVASLVFWGMKVFAPRTAVPAQAQMPARTLAMGGELRKLLGTSEKPPVDEEPDDKSDRFHLLGVVAPRGAGQSPQAVALISVDNQPPKAWRAGSVVDGDTVLLAVSQRSVQLGPRGGPPSTELTLPDPSSAVSSAPRVGLSAVGRPAPMMPQQSPQQAHNVAPQAQPVQRPATPQQADEDTEED